MRAVPLLVVALLGACGDNTKASVDAAQEPPEADASEEEADAAIEADAPPIADAFVQMDASDESPTIVYVVRHAEATSPIGDPSLSEDGIARAQRLAELMADKQLAAIETTELNRTKETGTIVANRVGLTIEIQPVGDTETYPTRLADHVKQAHAGKSTLIVGHSNTVPPTVEALSGQTVPPILPIEYDKLYTVTIAPDGTAQLVSGTY